MKIINPNVRFLAGVSLIILFLSFALFFYESGVLYIPLSRRAGPEIAFWGISAYLMMMFFMILGFSLLLSGLFMNPETKKIETVFYKKIVNFFSALSVLSLLTAVILQFMFNKPFFPTVYALETDLYEYECISVKGTLQKKNKLTLLYSSRHHVQCEIYDDKRPEELYFLIKCNFDGVTVKMPERYFEYYESCKKYWPED